jgi:alginate O-acetyltransferase complex protein AlgI
MVFSSLLFIFFFLPIALLSFYVPKIFTKRNVTLSLIILTGLSFIFYFFGSGKMMILLVLSILINWYIGKYIISLQNISKRKLLLILGIGINISILLYFKYTRFILDSFGYFMDTTIAPELNPYLPVGISFYTFMAIAYLVDVYRNKENQASLLEFGTFLSLFPHLVAGPIVRFQEISQELREQKSLSVDNFYNGIVRFTMGLGMKVLIADNIAPTVDKIFALEQSALTPLVAWLGAFAYTFQIYFDFAGYSAMAIGLALMFGFHFPENFNRPYLASSITEFWRRWHMSLSRWFKDYVYIPLGGNQKGIVRTYINLLIVFLITGLWHGAALTFIVWGLYYGILIVFEKILTSKLNYNVNNIVGIIITFLLVLIGWVVFRSESMEQSLYFLNTMFSLHNFSFIMMVGELKIYYDTLFILSLTLAIFFSFVPNILSKLKVYSKLYIGGEIISIVVILIFVSVYLTGNDFKPFIYFRF